MRERQVRSPWRRWLLWCGVGFGLVMAILVGIAYQITQRLEPYIREQTSAYLRQRFHSELEWSRFRIRMSLRYPLMVLLREGKGVRVVVEAYGIVLRHKGRTDIPPLVTMQKLAFDVELSEALGLPAHVRQVRMDGLELNIPPRGERPRTSKPAPKPPLGSAEGKPEKPSVIVDQILVTRAGLKLLPRDSRKPPLEFEIHRVRLDETSLGLPMRYDATLSNAKPPGLINSNGTFGPWVGDDPGETPLAGTYDFRDADLSVFKGIAGILSSTGKFQGALDEIVVDGETDTPNFRLESGGNPLPLRTRFHAIVDGTNGDTLLQPVEATLNTTRFTAHGAVARNPDEPARAIVFDVTLEEGRVEDLLLLAVKGQEPLLEGGVNLKMKLHLLPEKGELADRLRLDGNFELLSAHFTSPDTQEKIDSLSRRGQGKPKNSEISDVASDFVGKFRLNKSLFTLENLEFGVPGALVHLTGTYTFGTESLDLRGQLRLQARLSKTMTGWKRIVLTPIDPFFAKDGAGTVLNIKVSGTRSNPQFGLDR